MSKILCVGSVNGSFEVCLLNGQDDVTVTFFDSEDDVTALYKSAAVNIKVFKEHKNATVMFDVDATALDLVHGLDQNFDRIIFNYPHSSEFLLDKNWLASNQTLIRKFIKKASAILSLTGQIHITTHTLIPFILVDMDALIDLKGSVQLIGRQLFKKYEYPGYQHKMTQKDRTVKRDQNSVTHIIGFPQNGPDLLNQKCDEFYRKELVKAKNAKLRCFSTKLFQCSLCNVRPTNYIAWRSHIESTSHNVKLNTNNLKNVHF